MAELEMALKQMSEENLRYRLNQDKNDFSTWVRDLISDEELASDLQDSSTRAQAARYVSDRISQIRRQTATR